MATTPRRTVRHASPSPSSTGAYDEQTTEAYNSSQTDSSPVTPRYRSSRWSASASSRAHLENQDASQDAQEAREPTPSSQVELNLLAKIIIGCLAFLLTIIGACYAVWLVFRAWRGQPVRGAGERPAAAVALGGGDPSD